VDDVNAAGRPKVLDPERRIVRAGGGADVDLSQIVPYVLAHAQWIGPALLAAGIALRLAGRALSRVLLAVGLLATAALAYREWQAMQSLLLAGGILLAGVVLFGLLAWTVRGISFLFAFVMLAAGWYLVLYGWMGPSLANSTTGSLAWAGAAILTMIASGYRGLLHRSPVPTVGAGPIP